MISIIINLTPNPVFSCPAGRPKRVGDVFKHDIFFQSSV